MWLVEVPLLFLERMHGQEWVFFIFKINSVSVMMFCKLHTLAITPLGECEVSLKDFISYRHLFVLHTVRAIGFRLIYMYVKNYLNIFKKMFYYHLLKTAFSLSYYKNTCIKEHITKKIYRLQSMSELIVIIYFYN